MTPPDRASWPRAALLLLWVPGGLSLSGPRRVTGTVGGSLSVQCRYEEKFADMKKYWCESPCLSLLKKIVETTETQRAVSRGRVSIRDHPENLTFTVTLENLREGDAGTYQCGIVVPWNEGLFDTTFRVEVSVSPAPISVSPTTSATAKPPTTSAKIPTRSTAPAGVNVTHRANIQDNPPPSPGPRLYTLLVFLAFLLLLLLGTSVLARTTVRRQTKAGGHPEPLQNPNQTDQQREPCYANLELQTWPLQGDTATEAGGGGIQHSAGSQGRSPLQHSAIQRPEPGFSGQESLPGAPPAGTRVQCD